MKWQAGRRDAGDASQQNPLSAVNLSKRQEAVHELNHERLPVNCSDWPEANPQDTVS